MPQTPALLLPQSNVFDTTAPLSVGSFCGATIGLLRVHEASPSLRNYFVVSSLEAGAGHGKVRGVESLAEPHKRRDFVRLWVPSARLWVN